MTLVMRKEEMDAFERAVIMEALRFFRVEYPKAALMTERLKARIDCADSIISKISWLEADILKAEGRSNRNVKV
jgi:hypothetical protein